MNRIKKLRKEKSMTVADLAKKIGISQSMLSNYENGNSQPRDQQIWKKLADTLGVDVGYLMGFSNQKPIPMEEFYSLLDKSENENSNLSFTIKGPNSAFFFFFYIAIQDIYSELDEPKQKVLYEVAQALMASQLLSNFLADDNTQHD